MLRTFAVDRAPMFDAERARFASLDPMSTHFDLQPAIAARGTASAGSGRFLIQPVARQKNEVIQPCDLSLPWGWPQLFASPEALFWLGPAPALVVSPGTFGFRRALKSHDRSHIRGCKGRRHRAPRLAADCARRGRPDRHRARHRLHRAMARLYRQRA